MSFHSYFSLTRVRSNRVRGDAYTLKAVMGVDMFPSSNHIEAIFHFQNNSQWFFDLIIGSSEQFENFNFSRVIFTILLNADVICLLLLTMLSVCNILFTDYNFSYIIIWNFVKYSIYVFTCLRMGRAIFSYMSEKVQDSYLFVLP